MLDKEKREKGELSGKLSDLNKQCVETLEKLISLKDKQMQIYSSNFTKCYNKLFKKQKNYSKISF